MVSFKTRILILCKTYPSPSGKHVETSCVAGMDECGRLFRIFPVPFRLIGNDQQFKKWQWISARVEKAPADHRPESHRIYVDTIECLGEPLPTKDNWKARRAVLDKAPVFDDFDSVEAERQTRGVTLALLRPSRVLGLDITPVDDPEWTDEEREKLIANERQANLFGDPDARSLTTLRKLPFAFHYRYECIANGGTRVYRHKLADWEVGALFWNCRRRHGAGWEGPFRSKLEEELPAAELMFLMGTIHRFPNQWLIVSMIYPPSSASTAVAQFELL